MSDTTVAGGVVGCAPARALNGVRAVAFSPNGEHAYAVSDVSRSVAVFDRDRATGALRQLSGEDGCWANRPVANTSTADCHDGVALTSPGAVAVSPDGKHVYVASKQLNANAVAVFQRDPSSGALTQLTSTGDDGLPDACVSTDGSIEGVAGVCAPAIGIRTPWSIAISGDGGHLYVTARSDDAIAVFRRDSDTGALRQPFGNGGDGQPLGCVSETGGALVNGEQLTGVCADGRLLDGAFDARVAPNDGAVFVASRAGLASDSGNGVAVFARDTTSGALSQLAGQDGCVNAFGRSSPTAPFGDCRAARGLQGVTSLGLGPSRAYAVAYYSDALTVFDLQANGAPVQRESIDGCISSREDGRYGTVGCGQGIGMHVAESVALAGHPRGTSIYVAATQGGGSPYLPDPPDLGSVSVFSFDEGNGWLSQLPGGRGCFSSTAGSPCNRGRALRGADKVTTSPDGANVYVTAPADDAVAVFSRTTEGQAPSCSNLALGDISPFGTTVAPPCSDPTNDLLAARVFWPPNHGQVLFDRRSGRLVYFPTPGYRGTDAFLMRATDGADWSEPVWVTLRVADPPPPPPPPAPPPAALVRFDVPARISVAADGTLRPAIRCWRARCRGELFVRRNGRALNYKAPFDLARGARRVMSVRLGVTGRRLVRTGRPRVQLVARYLVAGRRTDLSTTVTLVRAPVRRR